MDIYKALAEAVGEDGLRPLGVTSGGTVVSNFNQKKLMEMSLAADAQLDAGLPAPGGKNMIPSWAVTHMGDEPKAEKRPLVEASLMSNEIDAVLTALEKEFRVEAVAKTDAYVVGPVEISQYSPRLLAIETAEKHMALVLGLINKLTKFKVKEKGPGVLFIESCAEVTEGRLPKYGSRVKRKTLDKKIDDGEWEVSMGDPDNKRGGPITLRDTETGKTTEVYVESAEVIEADAEDAGIELGIDEQDGTMVPAAMFNGNVYYWTGSGFSEDREDGVSFTDSDEADAELAKVEEFINSQMEESDETDFATILSELKGNPWHSDKTGKFSSKDGVNSSGKGSLSLRGDKRSKQKVKGSGKDGPKMVKTPNICGRAARKQGMNVRCWTGTPFPAGYGKTPKNLTAKGMKTKNPGSGRNWRKGKNDAAVGRAMLRKESVRGEWVDVALKDVLFELDLNESEALSWSLVIEDKAAVVQQNGDNDFVWESYWIKANGDLEVISTGDAETVEEAWSDAAVGMGLEFTEAARKSDAPISVKRLHAVGSGEWVPNPVKPDALTSRGGYTHTKENPHPKGSKKARAWEREQGKSVAESSYEKDMDPSKPVKVDYVKGMKSKPGTKKFKNMAAYEKWADSEEASDYTIQSVYNESDLGENTGTGVSPGPMRRGTIIGTRGDLESIKAQFDGEAKFTMAGGTMVVKADADTLRRIKKYADANLGVDIREEDEESDTPKAGPRWRKNSQSTIDRLRSLGV